MIPARRITLQALGLGLLGLAGCSTLPPPADPQTPYWQGRLSVKVASEPPQAFSAHFALQGSAQTGDLVLSTALGNTLAQLHWNPRGARLEARGETRYYPSLAELSRHATGTELPIAHWFAWLQGQAAEAPGWTVNLQAFDAGRISASRHSPAPKAELRLLVELPQSR